MSANLSSRLLSAGPPLLMPGVFDALAARVVVEAGFEAVYVSGAGVTNAALGMPDIGLVTLTELGAQVEAIREVVDVPVVVDADTGFGNALNVRRTVRALERRGANAIQLEDQTFPKRCGHFAGKEVIAASEMVGKIKAAVDARREDDTLIMARTDARQALGLETAIERAGAYREAGADIIFVEAPESREELAEIGRRLPAPLLANMVEGGGTPIVALDELSALGFSIVLYANAALRAAVHGMRSVLGHLHRHGSTAGVLDRLIGWDERQRLVGKPLFDELDRRYAPREGDGR